MKQLISNTRRAAFDARMSIFWFCLFSINSLCTCIVASMAGCVWSEIGPQDKFTIIVAIVGNWTGTIMAFIKQSSKPAKDETPISQTEQTPPCSQ